MHQGSYDRSHFLSSTGIFQINLGIALDQRIAPRRLSEN
jgi:hypothetical protein